MRLKKEAGETKTMYFSIPPSIETKKYKFLVLKTNYFFFMIPLHFRLISEGTSAEFIAFYTYGDKVCRLLLRRLLLSFVRQHYEEKARPRRGQSCLVMRFREWNATRLT